MSSKGQGNRITGVWYCRCVRRSFTPRLKSEVVFDSLSRRENYHLPRKRKENQSRVSYLRRETEPATLFLAMVSQSFWDAAANLISITEKHPFLVSMVDGSLSYENFRYYVIQDALYLTDYANCLHMLGDKLSSIDVNKANQLHQFAVGAEEDEKEMHRTFFKNWGEIDMTNVKAMPSTREFLQLLHIYQCIHKHKRLSPYLIFLIFSTNNNTKLM